MRSQNSTVPTTKAVQSQFQKQNQWLLVKAAAVVSVVVAEAVVVIAADAVASAAAVAAADVTKVARLLRDARCVKSTPANSKN